MPLLPTILALARTHPPMQVCTTLCIMAREIHILRQCLTGPGRYAPPVLGHTAPAYSTLVDPHAHRGSGARLDRVQGLAPTPGADMRKQNPPAYSIPGRGDGKADTSATARLGPGSYTPTVDAYKHKASAFPMGRPSSAPPRPLRILLGDLDLTQLPLPPSTGTSVFYGDAIEKSELGARQ